MPLMIVNYVGNTTPASWLLCNLRWGSYLVDLPPLLPVLYVPHICQPQLAHRLLCGERQQMIPQAQMPLGIRANHLE